MASILLIGFMGAGKTTIGKGLAQRLQKEYVDLDTKIEEHIQLSIAEYFHYYGEKSFRKVESDILRKLSNYRDWWRDCPKCKKSAFFKNTADCSLLRGRSGLSSRSYPTR